MSREWRTDRFRLVESDGTLRCFSLSPRELRVTRFAPDGGVDVTLLNSQVAKDPADKKLLDWMDRTPVFAAAYRGDKEWEVDLDAGFQRWRGYKSERDVVKALRNCGLTTAEVKEIKMECHKFSDAYCPRVL